MLRLRHSLLLFWLAAWIPFCLAFGQDNSSLQDAELKDVLEKTATIILPDHPKVEWVDAWVVHPKTGQPVRTFHANLDLPPGLDGCTFHLPVSRHFLKGTYRWDAANTPVPSQLAVKSAAADLERLLAWTRLPEPDRLTGRQAGLLVVAAIFHHMGEEARSLQLARVLLDPLPKDQRARTLNALVDLAGSGRYAFLLKDAQEGDWRGFHEGLKSLQEQAGGTWSYAEDFDRLIKRVAPQADRVPPVKLTPALAAHAAAVENWLLQDDLPGPLLPFAGEEDAMPWTLLSPDASGSRKFPESLGLEAVPILAALLDDDTLTPVIGSISGENFIRPLSRAERATRALRKVMPGEGTSDDAPDPRKSKDVLDWHAKMSALSPGGRAAEYFQLRMGPRKELLEMAASSQDAQAHRALETKLLPLGWGYEAVLYCQIRGLGAKPFVEALLAELEDPEERQFVSSYAVQLMERGFGGLPLLLDECVQGKWEVYSARDQIMFCLERLTPSQQADAVLPHLPRLVDPWEQKHLLDLLSDGKILDAPPEERGEILRRHRDTWAAVADMAARTIQQLDPHRNLERDQLTFRLRDLDAADGIRSQAVQRQRVEAILAGEVPAPVPDAEQVTETRREQMLEQLNHLTAAQIHPWLQALSPEELIALKASLEPPWPSALVQALNRLSAIEVRGMESTQMWEETWRDRMVNSDLLRELSLAVAKAAKDRRVLLTLTRQGFGGWLLEVEGEVSGKAHRRHAYESFTGNVFEGTIGPGVGVVSLANLDAGGINTYNVLDRMAPFMDENLDRVEAGFLPDGREELTQVLKRFWDLVRDADQELSLCDEEDMFRQISFPAEWIRQEADARKAQ